MTDETSAEAANEGNTTMTDTTTARGGLPLRLSDLLDAVYQHRVYRGGLSRDYLLDDAGDRWRVEMSWVAERGLVRLPSTDACTEWELTDAGRIVHQGATVVAT
jgi:hypothetical protein